jgi:hypothetical protein
MTKRGLQTSDDVSIQTIDRIKAMVASSRIFIFANGCIYAIIGTHVISQNRPHDADSVNSVGSNQNW